MIARTSNRADEGAAPLGTPVGGCLERDVFLDGPRGTGGVGRWGVEVASGVMDGMGTGCSKLGVA